MADDRPSEKGCYVTDVFPTSSSDQILQYNFGGFFFVFCVRFLFVRLFLACGSQVKANINLKLVSNSVLTV